MPIREVFQSGSEIVFFPLSLEEKATSLSPSTVIFFVISYVSLRESLLVREVARL
jgi:hypothetical protein